MPQLPDEVERSGDKNDVVRRGAVQCVFKRRFRFRDNHKMHGVVSCDFGKLRDGDGARGARLREDHLGGMRKKNTGNFVNGLVAQCAED